MPASRVPVRAEAQDHFQFGYHEFAELLAIPASHRVISVRVNASGVAVAAIAWPRRRRDAPVTVEHCDGTVLTVAECAVCARTVPVYDGVCARCRDGGFAAWSQPPLPGEAS